MAGENGTPWDLVAAGGGGKESLGSDGAGEDETVGGDEESADGGEAVEGEGLRPFGGDGAAGRAVEELDDMTRRPRDDQFAQILETLRMCSPASSPRLPPPRPCRRMRGGGGSRTGVTAPALRPLPVPGRQAGTAASSGSGQARSAGTCAGARQGISPRRHLTRGEK